MVSSRRERDLYAGEDLGNSGYRPKQAGFVKRFLAYATLALGLATMGDWKEAYSDEPGEPQRIERSDPAETRITSGTDLDTVFKYLREGYVLGSRDPKDYVKRDLAFFNGIYTRANNVGTFEEAKQLFDGVLKETGGLADANLVKEAQKAFREYASSHKKGERIRPEDRRELALKTTGIVQNYMQGEETQRWKEAGVDYSEMDLAGVRVRFKLVPGEWCFVGTNDMKEIMWAIEASKADESFNHQFPNYYKDAILSEWNGTIPENEYPILVQVGGLEGGLTGLKSVPSFFAMTTEVTTRLYQRFVDETGRKLRGWEVTGATPTEDPSFLSYLNKDGSRPPGLKDFPVDLLTFQDVQDFVSWLNGNYPDRKFTLLTEDQWEAAAGRKDRRLYVWGDKPVDPRDPMYNRDFSQSAPAKGEKFATMPVGSFEKDRSVYGALDLSANAYEITRTVFVPKVLTEDGRIITSTNKVDPNIMVYKGNVRHPGTGGMLLNQKALEFHAAETRLAYRHATPILAYLGSFVSFRIGIEPPDLIPQSPPAEVGMKDPEPPRSPEPNGGGPGIGRLDFVRQLLSEAVE